MRTFLTSCIALLLVGLSTTTYAQEKKTPIQEQILQVLEDDGIGDELKRSSDVAITFFLDGQGKVVLLDLTTENQKSANLVKESLQALTLCADQSMLEKTYKLDVTFDIMN